MTQCRRASSSTCWRRSPSTRLTATARHLGSSSNLAPSCACRSAPASRPASCGPLALPAATTSSRSPRYSTGRRSAPPLRDFIDWTARWTLAPRGMLLRMAIRAGEVAEPPAPKFGLVATGKAPTRMTEARARVLAALAENGAPTPKAALAARAACSTSVIDGLVADGALEAVALAPESGVATLDPDFRPTHLNADQRAAADDLIRLVADRAFSTTLLEGVTGSGKTEVYFEAVAEALAAKTPGACAPAGDCAHRAISRSLRGAFRRKTRRMAFRPDRAPARTRLDGGRRAARRRWLSARARRSFCRSPTSASSSSTRSTRAPTSRRKASSTTRATWRWCARGSRRRRSCSPRRRRRSRPGSTPKADATAGSGFPLASARRGCPTSPWSTSSAKVRRAADGCRRAQSPASKRRGPGASRRCCS